MATILLVEDNREWLDILKAMLLNNGHGCIPVGSIQQAIASLRNNSSPDLIILDIMLKNESGFDLLRYMKQFIRYRHLPIIMCSSMKEREAIVQSVKLGAQDYLLKPVKEATLLAKIKAILDAKKGVILIVSKDKTRIRLLSQILIRLGYLTISVDSAKDALKELAADPTVRLVISDMAQRQGEGLGLLVEVKTSYQEIPVLMIPERPGGGNFENIIASGADGIIRIPYNGMEIANTIESCMPAFR